MRIISWNCQGAFRKKAEIILLHKPDILIIQECEHPDKLTFETLVTYPNDMLWFGDNKNKGLGIFSYSHFRFHPATEYNHNIKFIAPIYVSGGNYEFTLFAIWANNRFDPSGQYVEQIWKAIHYYDTLLRNSHTILIGDFNSNKIWDRPRRKGNHSEVVEKLADNKIYSIYHKYLNQEQGNELHPTFFLQRNKNKPYHLDYCFASDELYCNLKNIEIGIFEKWIGHSDHVPLIIDFNI